MKKILLLHDDNFNLNKIKYVMDFIFELPFCKERTTIKYKLISSDFDVENFDILMNYSDKHVPNAKINIIKSSSIFSVNSFQDILKFHSNQYIKNKSIYYGVSKNKNEPKNLFEGNKMNMDIISTIFFHISRIEEFYCPNEKKDYHNRMVSENYFLVRNNLEKIPVVDKICVEFLKFLNLYERIKTKKIMTHDIDVLVKYPSLYKYFRGLARILFKRNLFSGNAFNYTYHYLKVLLGSKDPFKTFSWLLNDNFFDKKLIFFMSGGKTEYDNFYNINNPILNKIFLRVKNFNYEIGLHPSYVSSLDRDQMKKEKKILEEVTSSKIMSSRQHILRFDFKKTPKILEKSGIRNDYTFGYYDRIGFRCGTGFSFKLWNHIENDKYQILETPLVIMDGCLLIESNYNVKDSIKKHKNFMKENMFDTQISYNFHNSVFDPVLLDSEFFKNFYLNL